MTKNHWIAIASSVLVIGLIVLQGCSATAVSPFSGTEVTAEQLEAEVTSEKKKLETEAALIKSETERKIAEVQAAQKKSKSAFDRAVAKVQSDASNQIADLAAQFEQGQIEVEALTSSIVMQATSKMADLDAKQQSNQSVAQQALKEIESKQAKYDAVLSVGQTIASGFGPFGGLAAGAIGLGGVLFGMSKKKDAQAIHETAGRIVDAIDMLKDKRPEVAEAFKSESEFIKSWMGQTAISFVDKVQKS